MGLGQGLRSRNFIDAARFSNVREAGVVGRKLP